MQTEDHDTDKCPFAHPGEKAVRRDVRVYKYSPEACPATQVRAVAHGGLQEQATGCFSKLNNPSCCGTHDLAALHTPHSTELCHLRHSCSARDSALPAISSVPPAWFTASMFMPNTTVSLLVACLQQKNGECPRGVDCPLSHTVFERWLHPQR
jgi:hypothetical protein